MATGTINLQTAQFSPDEINKAIQAGLEAQKNGDGTNRIVPADDPDAPTVFKQTVNIGGKEMTFTGDSPESVLSQVTAASNAASAVATKPAEEAKPQPKPALTQEEITKYGIEVQKGNVTALKEFVLKSGMLSDMLAAEGISVEDIKRVKAATVSNETAQSWTRATEDFLKVPGNDWPGGEQNNEIIGMVLGKLNLQPSVESIQKAYDYMKEHNLVVAVSSNGNGNGAPKQKARSSTAVGADGGTHVRQPQSPDVRNLQQGTKASSLITDYLKLDPRSRDAAVNRWIQANGADAAKKVNWTQ
jgi:hypothetical protein